MIADTSFGFLNLFLKMVKSSWRARVSESRQLLDRRVVSRSFASWYFRVQNDGGLNSARRLERMQMGLIDAGYLPWLDSEMSDSRGPNAARIY